MKETIRVISLGCALLWMTGCATRPQQTAHEPLSIYQPTVKFADIYFPHPGVKPLLKYNHDVDIVKFKGRFFAAWNANATPAEGVPGQYNFLSVSDDFERWSTPVRLFYKEGGCENPIETDNQWQPDFINYKDQTLFCAWCDFKARRTFIAASQDGLRWRNNEVPTAPAALAGKVVGFPTNHGLLTRKGLLMFPCSLTPAQAQFSVGQTVYAGVLISADGGKSWQWSEPIEALPWSKIGEKPADFGGEAVSLWEPMLFEEADGSIGLLIRNSTAQEAPERMEKPHRMLLYAVSKDQGRTWTKARTVELDTICSRNYAVAGACTPDSLLMVMNDNHVRIPERISHDRYFLSLFCSPVCDPDLLLPGPLVQPLGGPAFYPNGFVDRNRLYIAYTYPNEIHSSVISPLPDFSKPFLLPRDGRPGLRVEKGIATFGQRQSSLGLVLTEKLVKQPKMRLAFDVNIVRYQGGDWPILTLGGKTRQGTTIRAIYSAEKQSDMLQVATGGGRWADLAAIKMKIWNHVEAELTQTGFSVSVNGAPAQHVDRPLLRKVCFGGLYVAPDWPTGMVRSSEVRLNLDTLVVE